MSDAFSEALSDQAAAVRVQFFGICTHLTGGPDTPHRVLLVNASDPERIRRSARLTELDVHPHVALLQIRNGDLTAPVDAAEWLPLAPEAAVPDATVWRLEGVTIRIPGAIQAPGLPTPGPCIPSLHEYCGTTLAGLREAALNEPLETACIFEIPPGSVRGMRIHGGAAVGVVELESKDGFALELTPFDGNDTIRLGIRPGAEVTVSNLPLPEGPSIDKNADFLLHFLVTGEVPADATFPEKEMACALELHTDNFPGGPRAAYTGPGCSNSNYP